MNRNDAQINEWPGISEALPGAKLRVLSLGAGVQSTTLALMGAHGRLPMPDFAVFADTGWEPARVYRHLEWLIKTLPFPVHVVRREGPDLGQLSLSVARGERSQKGAPLVPFFSGGGISPKQCSKEFKTRPVARFVLSMLDAAPKPKTKCVEMWLGISTDEMQRMKQNERPWIQNRWPLIEARMNRVACEKYLSECQVKAPRSSCVFCGFHTKPEWQDVMTDPEDGPRAIAFDNEIRTLIPAGAYLTPAEKPLSEIDFSNKPSPQGDFFEGFTNECEGVCGN